MSRARLFVVALTLTCALAVREGRAEGAPPKASAPAKSAAPKAPKLDLPALKHTLETGNEQAVLGALAELGAAKGPGAAAAAPLVNDLLARGSNATVLLAALDLARELAQQSSTSAVLSYLRHRSSAVRRGAARALGATGGPDAVAALRAALRDADPAVRAAAATSLGAQQAHEAVPDLFLVLAKPAGRCDCAQGDAECNERCEKSAGSMPEAAATIGLLCAPAECQRLVELLGKVPFELLKRGLEPLLLRPETEVAEGFKLDVIERLRKLQTAEARAFLETVRSRYPEKGSAHVRFGLDAAVTGKPVPKPKS